MYERWTKEEENILFSLYKDKSLDELALILNKTKEQVKTKGWRHNLTFMDYWSEIDDDYIREHYTLMTYAEIALALGRTKSAVQSRCHKLGLMKKTSSKKKVLNSNYFESIDTEEKAYWLGFISADGCVSWNNYKNAYFFKITLQQSDSDYLRKFIHAIDGKFDVKLKTTKVKFNDAYKEYPICEVSFTDKKFTSDLLKYISVNKTEYMRIPSQVPSHLIRHYIRGFSDGDGCFYCNAETRRKSYSIVGKCYDLLNDIRNELESAGIHAEIYPKAATNWRLVISRQNEISKLDQYFYKDATVFMERKYLKLQEIIRLAS